MHIYINQLEMTISKADPHTTTRYNANVLIFYTDTNSNNDRVEVFVFLNYCIYLSDRGEL